MPDLNFTVEKAEAVRFAAAPTLAFSLRVSNALREEEIHTAVGRCQLQIEVARRRYTPAEQARLHDLFDSPERWGQTLRNLHWTHANLVLPAFHGETVVEMQVPCTFDFNVAVTKYFDGLEGGDIPLCLMFSGTVFYFAGETVPLQVAPIPWSKETSYRLPVRVWKEMMAAHYPNSAWLCLRRDVMERLSGYKSRYGMASWDQAIEDMLEVAEQTVPE